MVGISTQHLIPKKKKQALTLYQELDGKGKGLAIGSYVLDVKPLE